MLKRLVNFFLILVGFFVGVLLVFGLNSWKLIEITSNKLNIAIYIGVGLIFALIFYLLSSAIINKLNDVVGKAEAELSRIPSRDILFGSLGLIVGLLIAYFLTQPLQNLPIPILGSALGTLLSVVIYLGLGYLGIRLAIKSKDDISTLFSRTRQISSDRDSKQMNENLKILDTSVIIDGRIIDIIRAGFIEGAIVLPNFVLEELQHIADSSDNLRRAKGRRGLDILREIQGQSHVKVIIKQDNYDDIKEVDSKILGMAKDLNAKVITNDYNLNKVAGVRGIEVLSINELANAVKPVVIPGEEMNVNVIKDGKEANQGLGYLDDGTMIVVEEGRRYIGKNIDVIVTSVLQTAAGKMIFAKPKTW
ncbi:MAG: PIN domain-containing protein [Tissierellia bacterium]|nr:PIN domain-containing protein [Tissierellia bacterium]